MGLKLQSTWGTHTWVLKVTWVGVSFCWGSTAESGQGHIKVISRSSELYYWIKTFFLQLPYICLFQKSVQQGCSWHIVVGKPSNTHPMGYGDYMWLGGVIPRSYINRPLLYHTLYQRKHQCKNRSIIMKFCRTWASSHKTPEAPSHG